MPFALLFLIFYFAFGIMTNLMLLGPIIWTSWCAWAVLLMWPALWAIFASLIGFFIYIAVVFFAFLAATVNDFGFMQRWAHRRNVKRVQKVIDRIKAQRAFT